MPKVQNRGPKVVGVNEVQMKPGDWNCPECGFMNFANNKLCLRCREQRPKRQLIPGDWECPSCDFLNYSRNTSCRKCNHERPEKATTEYEEQRWRSPY
ncbi:hypothetical protein GH714_023057 [Hevea brasiliensis]|uniref:RanBP2-type domain-containing protein n=1 Tax=Hevea brasiliensis TaxID=3981 RepID=A0A6A6MYL9_HEVBR|nr:hypothetical protein GH714_023057 [Hevea brasiliensis]